LGHLCNLLTPGSRGDRAPHNDDFRRKAHAEDLAAYRKLLQGEPGNPLRHDAVADLYLESGQLNEAVAEYRASLQLNPDSAPTHYNLGFALSALGQRDAAVVEFESAVRLDPDYAQAHNNLGALLQLQGKADEALAHYQRAVALRPDNADAQANLGQSLSVHGRTGEAVDHLRTALMLKADHAQALAALAWIRATAADPILRDAQEAISFAERADAETRHRSASVLDALAAAYASAGRYADAIAVMRTAIEIAIAAGQIPIAAQFRERLELYQSGQPVRMRF
jgi:tetratricopeptide (TPR) repeat protein